MRLIDADALTELIATNVYPLCDAFNSRDYGMFWTGGIEKAINEMPTIDAVSVVHGEWIEHKERTIVMDNNFVDFFPTEYECSNCGLRESHYFINSEPHNYCPNCGAKMDGERKESE